jgi:signal transduction histidine kinase
MAERLSPTLKAVSDAVLAVTGELAIEEVLQRLVHGARELAEARYAALGLPDGEGGFSQFLTSGMSDQLIAAMGPLPRQHGMLGAMLETSESFRTHDIHDDPRFRGWWPSAHPDMRSFLGVPIVRPAASSGPVEEVIGAFYLTEKEDGVEFSPSDQELIELLAAHAAIAITNARLHERSRELSILSERNRLALELHDVVSQKLFSLVLNAEAAGTLLERDVEAARDQVAKLREIAREALDELRSLIFELRPPDLERDGLAGALRKHVEVLRRLGPVEIALELDAQPEPDSARDRELLRIVQEALQNALRHSRAEHVTVRMHSENGHLLLEVSDDGIGFDPDAAELRSKHLGLTSMEERARELGGRLAIQSIQGSGTTVRLETDIA